MKIPTVDILGYSVLNIELSKLKNIINYFLTRETPSQFTVINANKIYLADNFPKLKNIMKKSTVLLPEQAIVIGSRWLKTPIKSRITGIEFTEYILDNAAKEKYKIFLYGAKPEVIKTLVQIYKERFPDIQFVGYFDGYYPNHSDIIDEINRTNPDFLFVALGSPRQEFWIHDHIKKMNIKIAVGVGGSFDVLSGFKKRAPKWSQNGWEWLYRSLQDWHRIDLWKRYFITNPYFVAKIFHQKYLINNYK